MSLMADSQPHWQSKCKACKRQPAQAPDLLSTVADEKQIPPAVKQKQMTRQEKEQPRDSKKEPWLDA